MVPNHVFHTSFQKPKHSGRHFGKRVSIVKTILSPGVAGNWVFKIAISLSRIINFNHSVPFLSLKSHQVSVPPCKADFVATSDRNLWYILVFILGKWLALKADSVSRQRPRWIIADGWNLNFNSRPITPLFGNDHRDIFVNITFYFQLPCMGRSYLQCQRFLLYQNRLARGK